MLPCPTQGLGMRLCPLGVGIQSAFSQSKVGVGIERVDTGDSRISCSSWQLIKHVINKNHKINRLVVLNKMSFTTMDDFLYFMFLHKVQKLSFKKEFKLFLFIS